MTANRSNAKTKRPAPRLTMREVARLAGGVNPSTVSLALRNSPRISAEMRTRIQEIAERIGYRRDPLLDAFNQHRLKFIPQRAPRRIAAIADFPGLAELEASPVHAAARAGAVEAAARLHCHLDLFLCGAGQLTLSRLDSVLDARALRAVLLLGIRGEMSAGGLTWTRNCTVAVDSLHVPVAVDRVTPDFREATRHLWRRAWTRGLRRIAFVRTGNTPSQEDRAAAGVLLEQFRQPDAVAIPVPTLAPDRASRAAFKRWLRAYEPQLILHSAAGRELLLTSIAGERVPCLAFDGAPGAPGAGAVPDYFQVGRRAVEQLVALMQANQLGLPAAPACTYIPVPLVV